MRISPLVLFIALTSAASAQTGLYIASSPADAPTAAPPPQPDTALLWLETLCEKSDTACMTGTRLFFDARREPLEGKPEALPLPPNQITFNVNAKVTGDAQAESTPATGHMGLTYTSFVNGYALGIQINVLSTADVVREGFAASLLSPSSGGHALQSGYFQTELFSCDTYTRVGNCPNNLASWLDFIGGGFEPSIYSYASANTARWGRPLPTTTDTAPEVPDETVELTVLGFGAGARWQLDLRDDNAQRTGAQPAEGENPSPNEFAIGFYAGASVRALAGDGADSHYDDLRGELMGTQGTIWAGPEGGAILRIGGFVGEVRAYWLPTIPSEARGLGGLRVLISLSANVPLFRRPVRTTALTPTSVVHTEQQPPTPMATPQPTPQPTPMPTPTEQQQEQQQEQQDEQQPGESGGVER